MLFGGRKERQTEALIRQHAERVGVVISDLHKMAMDYCAECREYKAIGQSVLDGESKADSIRREIEQQLYDGAFMPMQRGDYAAMVEAVDKVANQCEAVAQFLMMTCPQLTEETREGMIDIMEATVRAYAPLFEMFDKFDEGLEVIQLSHRVEEEEKKVDDIFAKVVTRLFQTDLELAQKIHIKMLLDRTAAISNRIEDASDRFATIVSKRP